MKKVEDQEEDPLDNNDHQEQQEVISTPIEAVTEDDVLVEENVTPFYMNTGTLLDRLLSHTHALAGENLQQTFHRLGFDIPEGMLNEHHF